MISVAINAASSMHEFFSAMKIRSQVALNDLPCRITAISETQDYNLPQFPIESGEYRGDTIYRMPLKLECRLFVESGDFLEFENMLNDINFSEDFVYIQALNGKIYNNMKILSWSREMNSQMIGAAYYMVSLQEFVIIDSLAFSKNVSAAANGAVADKGTKSVEEKDSSTLFKFKEGAISFYKGLTGGA